MINASIPFSNKPDKKTYPPASLSWIVWGLGALFYLSGFYQRVAPAVLTDYLMADFKIGGPPWGIFPLSISTVMFSCRSPQAFSPTTGVLGNC